MAVDSYTFENPKDNESNAFLYLYKFGYIKFDHMNIVKAPEDILAGPIADFGRRYVTPPKIAAYQMYPP